MACGFSWTPAPPASNTYSLWPLNVQQCLRCIGSFSLLCFCTVNVMCFRGLNPLPTNNLVRLLVHVTSAGVVATNLGKCFVQAWQLLCESLCTGHNTTTIQDFGFWVSTPHPCTVRIHVPYRNLRMRNRTQQQKDQDKRVHITSRH